MTKVVLTNRLLIPVKAVPESILKKKYDKRVYALQDCARCPFKHEKHSEHCDGCQSYKGRFVSYKKVLFREKSYWSLPRAELYSLEKLGIENYKIENLMSNGTKLSKDLEILRTPYPYQEVCIEDLIRGDGRKDYFPHGILKAAPRSGKCVTGDTYINTKNGIVRIDSLFAANHKDGEVKEKIVDIVTPDGVEQTSAIYAKTVPETYRFVTYEGFTVQGTADHPVLVCGEGMKHYWKKMSEVVCSDIVCINQKFSLFPQNEVPLSFDGAGFEKYPKTVSPSVAKLFGYVHFHGRLDGELIKVRLSGKHRDTFCSLVQELFAETVIDLGEGTPLALENLKYKEFFKSLDYRISELDPKYIPYTILQSTRDSVKAYIEGIFANYISKPIGIGLELKSGQMATQLQLLLLQFGIVANRRRVKTFVDGNKRSVYNIFLEYEKYKKFISKFKIQNPPKIINASSSKRIPHFLKHYFEYNFSRSDAKDLYKLAKAKDFYYDPVVFTHKVSEPTKVFDVCVPGSHSFIGNGLVVHNTLMSLTAAVRLGRKTLILAKQEDLLKQFIIELKQSTNISDLDKFNGTQSFGICNTVEDFEKYQICLATYQKFITKNGKEKLKAIRKMFGTVFVDEAHNCAADAFSKVVDAFYAKNRFGLTATDKRKDGLEFVTQQILGDVVTEAKVDSLIPKVVIAETGVKPKYSYKTWHSAMQFLARNEERIALILRWIKKDLKAGRKIVIPLTYKFQVKDLVKRIRKMGYTAEEFVGGTNREKLLEKARSGKIDVVVGIRSILSTGVNVPCWSCLPADTLLSTEDGHQYFGDLFPGKPVESNLVLHNGEEPAQIDFGGRRKYNSTVIIDTQYGYELEATKGHKFKVLTPEFKVVDKEVRHITTDDYILTKSTGALVKKEYEIKNYSFDAQRFFGVFSHQDMDGKINCKICGIRTANLSAHYKKEHKNEEKPEILWTNYQKFQRHESLRQSDIIVPKTINAKLGYALGFVVSDGAVRKESVEFYNTKLKYLKRVEFCMEQLGVAGIWAKDKKELRYTNLQVVDFFHSLGLFGKSWEKEVPKCILQSPLHVISAFLSAYLDADGYVTTFKRKTFGEVAMLGFTGASKKMLQQMQHIIFHSYGIHGELQLMQKAGYVSSIRGVEIESKHDFYQLLFYNGRAKALSEQLTRSFKAKKLEAVTTKSYTKIPYLAAALVKHKIKRNDSDRFGLSFECSKDKKKLSQMIRKVPEVGNELSKLLNANWIPLKIKSIREGRTNIPVYDVSMANKKKPYYVSGVAISHNCIYTIAPINNPPNYYQETTRVCTPMENKPQPLIRIFVDDMPMTKGCFRSCYTKTYLAEKYIISEKSRETARRILSTMKNNGNPDDIEFDAFGSFNEKKTKAKSSITPIRMFG